MKQLPAFPEAIRHGKRGQYRGVTVSAAGYALALTRNQAFIWDYSSTSPSPNTRVFNLSHPAKNNDPIPIGALVPGGSGTTTGLVVVNATSGKISFWENIENADSLNLFEKRRNGAEGDCGGMLSGETVTNIENIGTAGFILTFSSGRTAQILVRDAQSRPAVAVNFLRGRVGGMGFFGGLKSVFAGGGLLKTIAAARRRPLQTREQTELLIGNEDALFQFWQMSGSGLPHMCREVNARAAMETVFPASAPEAPAHTATLVDFAFTNDAAEESELLLLVNYISSYRSEYALVEVDIDSEGASPRRKIPLYSYTDTVVNSGNWIPRICLPPSGHTAFVVFENAVSVVSLVTEDASPEAQFLMDSGQLPEAFQDTVHFRMENEFASSGVSIEPSHNKQRSSSVMIFIKNFGLIRVTAEEPVGEASAKRRTLSVKSKIEQAVFFGAMTSNPLKLHRKDERITDVGEIEEAALAISHEILASDSPHIVPVAASMAEHLERRMDNLRELAVYVFSLSKDISRSTRWKLRSDAEQMLACHKIWALYDTMMQARWREVRILTEALTIMDKSQKTVLDKTKGESDRVRLWCTKDVWRMHFLLEWCLKTIDDLQESDLIRDSEKYMDLLNEADSIVIDALDVGYRFRMESALLYGLQDEDFHNDLLRRNYEGLPELWTSSPRLLYQIEAQLGRLRTTIDTATEAVDNAVESVPAIKMMVADSVSLVEAYCRGWEERIRWLDAQDTEDAHRQLTVFRPHYRKSRTKLITGLLAFGEEFLDVAADIAATFRDMNALVEVTQEKDKLIEALTKGYAGTEQIRKAQELEAQAHKQHGHYFKLFGQDWAKKSYPKKAPSKLLAQANGYKPRLTEFLRSDPSHAKLSWINDIVSERDHATAARSLLSAAQDQEMGLWSKKVELSLGKLALIATEGSTETTERNEVVAKSKDEDQLVKIQERLYEHVRPCLYDAVDEAAELQLAMETFGNGVKDKMPALYDFLENGLEDLIQHRAMGPEKLIDVLTLLDRRPCSLKEHNIAGRETYLALQVLNHSGFTSDRARFDLMLKLIWQRCYIRDDWTHVNNTGRKADADAVADLEDTTLFLTIYQGLLKGESGLEMTSLVQS